MIGTNNNILEIKNLKKYYKMKDKVFYQKTSFLKAVDGVDLNIRSGESFGIVGESGCGKSTIGQMLVNLIKPSAGEIFFNNKKINIDNKKEIRALKKNLQIVFQDPYASLNPKKKIGWLMNEALLLQQKDLTLQERKQVINEMIRSVGLHADFLEKYPHELSGGQRQRISIAVALMVKPSVLVADEPVSALDVSIQAQILNLLNELKNSMNLTLIFISHDLNVVYYISDRIGVMYLGKFVEIGDVEDIYNFPMHPYTKALLSSIPVLDNSDDKVEKIYLKGDVPSPIDTKEGCAFSTRCQFASEKCYKKTPPLIEKKGRMIRCFQY